MQRFSKFIEKASGGVGLLDLEDRMIRPVQRLPRYRLLLEDTIKATPASNPEHEVFLSFPSSLHAQLRE